MWLRVGCEFVHELDIAVHAVVQVEPRLDGRFRLRSERWSSEPDLASSRYVDTFGNLCRRLDLPVGRSALRYDTLVELVREADPAWPAAPEVAPSDLPDEALAYTLPSRLCPSDELAPEALTVPALLMAFVVPPKKFWPLTFHTPPALLLNVVALVRKKVPRGAATSRRSPGWT